MCIEIIHKFSRKRNRREFLLARVSRAEHLEYSPEDILRRDRHFTRNTTLCALATVCFHYLCNVFILLIILYTVNICETLSKTPYQS